MIKSGETIPPLPHAPSWHGDSTVTSLPFLLRVYLILRKEHTLKVLGGNTWICERRREGRRGLERIT
jgi:hypothetical protein